MGERRPSSPRRRPNWKIALCILASIMLSWAWIDSTRFYREERMTTAVIFRSAGVAVGIWNGCLAVDYMNNRQYDEWNHLSRDTAVHWGTIELLRTVGATEWDWDLNWLNTTPRRFVRSWKFLGFYCASTDRPRTVWDRQKELIFDPATETYTVPEKILQVKTVALAVPIYAFIILSLLYPAFQFRRRLVEAKRRRSNLCVACGYNLLVHSDRCPECGAVVPEPP